MYQRLSGPVKTASFRERDLQFNLLSDPQSIVHLDTQVSDGAFKLGVTKQNLHGSEVASLLVNLCRLSSSQGVGPIGAGFKSDGHYPSLDNPGVLPGRQMLRRLAAAWEQIAAAATSDEWEPCYKCSFRLLSHFELYGPLCLLLDDGGSIPDRATRPQVFDPQSYKVASAKLAVYGEIEERQLSDRSAHFQSNTDRPHVLGLKWALLTNKNTLVPGAAGT
jgi:hypothetical protein